MAISTIIILIILGIILVFAEFLLTPGLSLLGIGGFLIIGAAIFLSFNHFSTTFGVSVLFGTLFLLFVMIIIALKNNTWDKISLKTNTTSSVHEEMVDHLQIGDSGKTISRLSPMGKIIIGEDVFEAKSLDGYVDPNTEVTIHKISGNILLVKIKK